MVILSIIGWNTTNKVRADIAAIQKMTKLEWRAKIESESSVANQFDIWNTSKIWIKQETKKSFSNWSILFTYGIYRYNGYSDGELLAIDA